MEPLEWQLAEKALFLKCIRELKANPKVVNREKFISERFAASGFNRSEKEILAYAKAKTMKSKNAMSPKPTAATTGVTTVATTTATALTKTGAAETKTTVASRTTTAATTTETSAAVTTSLSTKSAAAETKTTVASTVVTKSAATETKTTAKAVEAVTSTITASTKTAAAETKTTAATTKSAKVQTKKTASATTKAAAARALEAETSITTAITAAATTVTTTAAASTKTAAVATKTIALVTKTTAPVTRTVEAAAITTISTDSKQVDENQLADLPGGTICEELGERSKRNETLCKKRKAEETVCSCNKRRCVCGTKQLKIEPSRDKETRQCNGQAIAMETMEENLSEKLHLMKVLSLSQETKAEGKCGCNKIICSCGTVNHKIESHTVKDRGGISDQTAEAEGKKGTSPAKLKDEEKIKCLEKKQRQKERCIARRYSCDTKLNKEECYTNKEKSEISGQTTDSEEKEGNCPKKLEKEKKMQCLESNEQMETKCRCKKRKCICEKILNKTESHEDKKCGKSSKTTESEEKEGIVPENKKMENEKKIQSLEIKLNAETKCSCKKRKCTCDKKQNQTGPQTDNERNGMSDQTTESEANEGIINGKLEDKKKIKCVGKNQKAEIKSKCKKRRYNCDTESQTDKLITEINDEITESEAKEGIINGKLEDKNKIKSGEKKPKREIKSKCQKERYSCNTMQNDTESQTDKEITGINDQTTESEAKEGIINCTLEYKKKTKCVEKKQETEIKSKCNKRRINCDTMQNDTESQADEDISGIKVHITVPEGKERISPEKLEDERKSPCLEKSQKVEINCSCNRRKCICNYENCNLQPSIPKKTKEVGVQTTETEDIMDDRALILRLEKRLIGFETLFTKFLEDFKQNGVNPHNG